MLFKQNNKHVNKWKFSSTVDLKKFFIIICLPIIEMIITTILMCKFCDKCKNIHQYKWYLLGLIPSSVIFSLLMVTIRDMRARFPINYVFLFLNTLLLCYAFIPPILGITIGYIMISFSAAAFITFSMIILGMFIKVTLHVMGTFFILSVLPVLLFIGQQLKIEYSPWMLPSYYILYAVLVSVIYLFIFYSIAVQFLNHRNKSTCYSC
ncbi:hypothetical protein MS3_00004957 [Schistosoma haematobium]|uniref:Uncharacterized protein n=1 Tax=Schistosoma haematobium TaxID=6185 RepID=A0A922ITP6_SCHHA|nr:hypothetical protein MS3_00004957 [Schistosoma haematobium]KAH9587090.1 hypothetical protein MS3_00004957 [Schistosoma haematobium]